jgi:hypothetical protein
MPDDPGSAEDRWLLSPAEQALVATKDRANRLGFAILLTFFRERGRFPRDETEVAAQGIAALSEQLDAPTSVDGKAFLTGHVRRSAYDRRSAPASASERRRSPMPRH